MHAQCTLHQLWIIHWQPSTRGRRRTRRTSRVGPWLDGRLHGGRCWGRWRPLLSRQPNALLFSFFFKNRDRHFMGWIFIILPVPSHHIWIQANSNPSYLNPAQSVSLHIAKKCRNKLLIFRCCVYKWLDQPWIYQETLNMRKKSFILNRKNNLNSFAIAALSGGVFTMLQ